MEEFKPGDVIIMRSGGPYVTVAKITGYAMTVVYYNTHSGLFDTFTSDSRCFRLATEKPAVPEGATKLRGTSNGLARTTL